MNEGLPRSLLALTVVVAAGVLFLVIKDFVQHKNAKPPVSTNAPIVVDSNTGGAVQKKTTSLKPRRARIAGTEADDPVAATQAAADGTVKPIISRHSANSSTTAIVANNNGPNAARAAHDDQVTIGRNNDGAGNELHMIKGSEISGPDLSSPKCVPLPNVTAPADVDAPYYQNWAREYSCYDLIQAAADASH